VRVWVFCVFFLCRRRLSPSRPSLDCLANLLPGIGLSRVTGVASDHARVGLMRNRNFWLRGERQSGADYCSHDHVSRSSVQVCLLAHDAAVEHENKGWADGTDPMRILAC